MSKPEVIKHHYESGELQAEHYFLNNKCHNPDGPASIYYYKSGEVRGEYYYLNGKRATKKQIAEIKFNSQFDKDLEETLTK